MRQLEPLGGGGRPVPASRQQKGGVHKQIWQQGAPQGHKGVTVAGSVFSGRGTGW